VTQPNNKRTDKIEYFRELDSENIEEYFDLNQSLTIT
jgi:hypothetical protein